MEFGKYTVMGPGVEALENKAPLRAGAEITDNAELARYESAPLNQSGNFSFNPYTIEGQIEQERQASEWVKRNPKKAATFFGVFASVFPLFGFRSTWLRQQFGRSSS